MLRPSWFALVGVLALVAAPPALAWGSHSRDGGTQVIIIVEPPLDHEFSFRDRTGFDRHGTFFFRDRIGFDHRDEFFFSHRDRFGLDSRRFADHPDFRPRFRFHERFGHRPRVIHRAAPFMSR